MAGSNRFYCLFQLVDIHIDPYAQGTADHFFWRLGCPGQIVMDGPDHQLAHFKCGLSNGKIYRAGFDQFPDLGGE